MLHFPVFSHLTAEVELQAMALLMAEVTWLRWLLQDLLLLLLHRLLFLPQYGAIIIVCDPIKHELSKHIGFDASFMRSHVQDQVIALQYVPFKLQLQDFFMKAQTKAHHDFLPLQLKYCLSTISTQGGHRVVYTFHVLIEYYHHSLRVFYIFNTLVRVLLDVG